MSVNAIQNLLRKRAVVQSRQVKSVFLGEGGKLTRSGEAVLADLRDFCFAQESTFHPDARVQAQREGRREVWLRLTKFLNLDENRVQLLMEVDDGL
ncbi:hypothetical protein FIM10_01850 [Sphingomonadales bacterium 56]|uniref:Bbp19 family protein n=1 Tax=unclassified Sphingobium TaxID=2611147 RepID=UPI00191850B5|nr:MULTISPECIES: hypothetical protein [unclassified Sphingobium]MBY2927427.1 hypothetical protein [Sphingomonadales bacterium 56]MBY2957495.1 hypothetical protein [Sphingomonadales bacterium 58]MBY2957538.1 hypothetical protein [Sphingomonadales bacterium 58]CAD7335169.1 hypothetical protein SPHS8_00372 [Sphingobium sp. S8]CAD7335188.1 hypothetical protein SPHS6_00372 [Sphingobium sp. S6]